MSPPLVVKLKVAPTYPDLEALHEEPALKTNYQVDEKYSNLIKFEINNKTFLKDYLSKCAEIKKVGDVKATVCSKRGCLEC